MKEKKKKAPSRRNDVIRCPKCGEDYSITYKRCPFCEERPGRLGVAGSSSSHPIQLLMTILSFAVIITALFIVFKYVSPMILGHQIPGASTSADTSQSGDVSGDSSADPSLGDPSVPVNSLSLSRTDVTLAADERYHFTVTVDPETALVTWTSSDDSILTVDEKGTITNVNTGDKKVKVTVTATAGDKSAECTVYCNGNSTKPADNNNTDGNNTSGGNTTTPDNNTSGGNTMVNDVAFTADSHLLATAGANGCSTVFDLEKGQILRVLEPIRNQAQLGRVRFNRNGDLLMMLNTPLTEAWIYSVQDGTELYHLYTDGIAADFGFDTDTGNGVILRTDGSARIATVFRDPDTLLSYAALLDQPAATVD